MEKAEKYETNTVRKNEKERTERWIGGPHDQPGSSWISQLKAEQQQQGGVDLEREGSDW